jgi:mono/diheme cytochrome c family protein
MTHRTVAVGILLVLVTGSVCWLSAQGQVPVSVRDGVYTADQASRGEAAYKESCSSCHGDSLEGGGQAPPLSGSEFTSNWRDTTAWDLFNRIQVTMPADRPGRLSADQTALIVSYLFKANGFPAGSQPLPGVEDGLKAIHIEAAAPGK